MSIVSQGNAPKAVVFAAEQRRECGTANHPSSVDIERMLRADRTRFAHVSAVASVLVEDVDVYAPCALGATLTAPHVRDLKAAIVCGAANNQLATAEVADDLRARDILWVPDYVANAGGVVQVGGELYGTDRAEVEAKIAEIGATTTEILRSAERQGISTRAAADAVVEQRLAARRAELAQEVTR